jgi:hypothetical protein
MSDTELVELVATIELNYLGFKPTAGVCARCGSAPRGGSLHRFAIIGPKGHVLEIGPVCLFGRPTTGENWRVVLTVAVDDERDPARRSRLESNLVQFCKPRA